jgi:DNA-directed RNA polymerase subunit omega
VSAWPSSDREPARFLHFAIRRMLSRMRIEDVVDQVGNRFAAVVVSARRARQINAYFHQLGGGIGHYVPPQVHSLSRKPLTIAMEEISEGKVSVEREEG